MAMSRSSSSLTRTEVRRLKVAELRDELTSRGLDATGLKIDLLDRLLNDLLDMSSSTSASTAFIQDATKQTSEQPTKLVEMMIDPEIMYVLRYYGMQHHPSATASCGLVLYNSETEQTVWSGTQFYSTGESVQEAEMRALSLVLKNLSKEGIKKIIIQGPAKESTNNQLKGHFNVKSKHIQTLYKGIEDTMRKLEECEVWEVAADQVVKAQNLAKKSLENRVSEGFNVFQIENEGESNGIEHINDHLTSLQKRSVHEAGDEEGTREIGLDPVEDYSQETMHQHEEDPSFSPDKEYVLRFDGGSRGNPGTAGAGMVLYDAESGLEVWAAFQFLDETTNNVAEYTALLSGLQFASTMGITRLIAEGDSTLVVKQVTGEFAVKKEHLKPLRQSVKVLADGFASFSINYIPRAENYRADQLANVAMDEKYSMGLEVPEYMGETDGVAVQSRSQQQHLDGVDNIKASSTQSQSPVFASTFGSNISTEKELALPEAVVSEQQLSPHSTYVLKFGGSAKGQSTVACAAILLDDISGEEIWKGMHYIDGEEGSQFIAGYSGLIIGLRKALSMGAKRLIVEGSSGFVIYQMTGKWKVKSQVIKPYYMHAKDVCDNSFEDIDFVFAKEISGDLRVLLNDAMNLRKSQLQGFLLS